MPIAEPESNALSGGAGSRWWRQHVLVFAAYWVLGCAVYAWMRFQTQDHARFFLEQRNLSRWLLVAMGVHGLLAVAVHRSAVVGGLRRFWTAPASPHPLALMRILMGGFIFTHLIFYVPQHWLPLAGLPHEARQPLPMIGWLVEAIPISPALYTAAVALAIGFSALAILGLWTRVAWLALIPLICYVFGVPQFFGKLSHYQFFVWATVILAFSPCNRVWSVDALCARIRGIRIPKRPSASYALGLRWWTLTLVGIYGFSGVHKLYDVGLYWALSDNPVNLLRTEWLEQFQALPWIRVDRWPWLCQAAALGVMLGEITYPIWVLSPRGRVMAALGAISFHNLNGLLLKIDFVYLKTAHLAYFDIGKWVKALGRLRERWKAWVWVVVLVGVLGYFIGVLFLLPALLLGMGINLYWRSIPARKRVGYLRRLQVLLPPGPTPARLQARARRWQCWSIATGITLVALNWTCGALGLHSWPFSAYPSYSFVRDSTIAYGWFLPRTATGRELDLDEEAQALHFRKENILPMAERMVDAWKHDPERLEREAMQCWLRWRTEVPSLQAATQARVVIRVYPLDPDRYGMPVVQTNLGEMQLIQGKWQYIPDSISLRWRQPP